ncbi:hypothetical protein [Caloranaerobacter ferrireducens]|uniref:hypothetical protein n=1 Tax=Caloranaerobacter ferrireducens TaxID=1323370 RepID=UPI00084D585F|nr:hypothetical protein [Caloranaerobacter ferrireducens]
MDDKVFQLLEKMYSEMLRMKEDIYSKIHQLEEKMKQGFEEGRHDRVRLEQVLTDKIDILTDGVTQNSEKINRIEDKVNSIETMIKDKSIVVSKDYYIQLLKKAE